VQDYRKLQVWERAHQFVLEIYTATKNFPDDERYGLTGQLRRAAASIPTNIAEGCGRATNGELHHFLCIAMGSASECDYELLLARDLRYLDAALHCQLEQELGEIRRMLNALIQKTKERR